MIGAGKGGWFDILQMQIRIEKDIAQDPVQGHQQYEPSSSLLEQISVTIAGKDASRQGCRQHVVLLLMSRASDRQETVWQVFD